MRFPGCALFRHPQVFRHVSRVSCWLVTTSHYGLRHKPGPHSSSQSDANSGTMDSDPSSHAAGQNQQAPPNLRFPCRKNVGWLGSTKTRPTLISLVAFTHPVFPRDGQVQPVHVRTSSIYPSLGPAVNSLDLIVGRCYIHMMMMLEPWYFVCTYRTKASVHRYKVRRTLIQRRNG
jgi:hypothetical protein